MAKKKGSEDFGFEEYADDEGINDLNELKKKQQTYRCYSTGSFMLDLAIGVRDAETGRPGIPERAIVEMFGINSSAKTATMEQVIKSVLEADPKNHVFGVFGEEPSANRMERLGIDLSRVKTRIVVGQDGSRENSAERDLEQAKNAVLDPNVKLVVIDSVKSLGAASQMFDSKGKPLDLLDTHEAMCARANMMTRFLLNFKRYNQRAILFMTNQLTESIKIGGYGPQNPEYNIRTPGGTNMEFECSLRIKNQVKPIEGPKHPLFDDGLLLGWQVSYRIIKNKYSHKTAGRRALSNFYFDPPGFRREDDVLAIADYLDLISKTRNGHYEIEGKKVIGKDRAVELLKANPKALLDLENKIVERSEEFYTVGEAPKADLLDE